MTVKVIGNATMYLGDCAEVMRGLVDTCDAVLTSPPYNTLTPGVKPSGMHGERSNGVNKFMAKMGGYFDQRDEGEYQRWQKEILSLCLKCAPIAWINHKTRYRDGFGIHPLKFYDAPLFSEIIWDRGGSMALNCGRFAPSHEYIFGFGKPRKWDNSLNAKMSVWRVSPGLGKDADNDHPCPFPIALISPIIASCVFDKPVLDPFMGSGTTGVAALQLGRKFIGIEREPKYFEIACRRIREEIAQPDMFISKGA